MKYDSSTPLFVPPDNLFAVYNVEAALQKAIVDRKKPLLIYIHGRAKGIGEPQKSLEEGIYSNLAKYGVNTIGFTWDADDGGYDVSRPAASAAAFLVVLEKVQSYYARPENAELTAPSLITHSMGALLISELAKKDALGPHKPEFLRSLVLSAAAVQTKLHEEWLGSISVANQIFVLVNPKDKVLAGASFGPKPNMLGYRLTVPAVDGGRVTYVDLSDLKVNHRYFVEPGQKHYSSLREFYSATLTGKLPNFEVISRQGLVNGVNVRSLVKE